MQLILCTPTCCIRGVATAVVVGIRGMIPPVGGGVAVPWGIRVGLEAEFTPDVALPGSSEEALGVGRRPAADGAMLASGVTPAGICPAGCVCWGSGNSPDCCRVGWDAWAGVDCGVVASPD